MVRSGRQGLFLACVLAAVLPSACVDGLSFTEDSSSGGKNLAGSPDDSGADAGESSGGVSGPSGGDSAAGDGNGNGGGPGSGSGSSTGSGASGSGGDPSSGGVPGSGASPGAGGTFDPGVDGKPGGALVSLGGKMMSSNYVLVLTVGEAPGGNGERGILSSENYRLRAGLVATTEGE